MRLSKEEQAEEVVPLKAIHGGSSNKSISRSRAGPIQRLLGILTVIAAVALIFVLMEKKEDESIIPSDIESQNRTKIAKKQCPKFCKARLAQRISHQGGDLLHSQDLLVLATKAREDLIKTLKQDYGEDVFKAMFEEPDGTSRGYTAFWGAGDKSSNPTDQGPSKARFRRKLKIKLLEVQSAVLKEESSLLGCNCVATMIGSRHQDGNTNNDEVTLPEIPRSYSKFVWATGGHSAAAGHGNLYNESYTAYMERSVMNVFQAVGIDFVGRNYAMGGMSSGPEIALCLESLFGIDVDLISWDFGMTDGRSYFKKLFYANRIGMNRNKPAIVDLNIAGRQFNNRLEQIKIVEDQGLTAMYMNPEKWQDLEKGIPDMFGMSEDQMSKIAPYARDLKCKGILEKGDPTCGDKKFNKAICPLREGMTSWHPGWRVHAAYGTIMGLFLSDMLIDAIKELGLEPYDSAKKLGSLIAEEEAEYSTFYVSQPQITGASVGDFYEDEVLVNVIARMFRKTRIICHTALLPAEIRYLGILTETDMVGTHGYEKGVSQMQADSDVASESEKHKRQMRLTFDTSTRQANCPVDVKWDYKDFFYTTQNDGWTSLTVPNKAEMEYYIGEGAYEPEGVIVLCFVKCDWGKCPEGEMQTNEIVDGQLKLEVNGVMVTNVTKLEECGILQHSTGDYHFKPNSEGQFELRVSIGTAEKEGKVPFTRITSIVVF